MRFVLALICLFWPLTAAAAEGAWDQLASASFTEIIDGDNWQVTKTFPASLQAAAEGFEITGFFVPVIAQGKITEFLLVEDPDDCPFCGNGGYGPVLEVHSKRPMPDLAEFAEITLRGSLKFNQSTDTLQMFRLEKAVLVD